MSDARQRAALAERAVRAGGAVARDVFRDGPDVETKANKNDLVTDADRETQRQIVHTITQEFPRESFVCEETLEGGPGSGKKEGTPQDGPGPAVETVPDDEPCWVVDPIDGTANFVRGIRVWSTSIAAVSGGSTVAAATYLPAVQDIYTAGPDSATCNGEQLAVSERIDPETFAIGLVAYWPSDRSEQFGDLARSVATEFGDSRRFGSCQATLAYVAAGGLEAAVTTEETTAWDTMAGVHLVREAGGTVTDLDGEPWSRDATGLVASNGEDHDTVLRAVDDAVSTE